MASASPNSRTSIGLVRATGPVGTHQLLSMPSLLHKLYYPDYLLLSITIRVCLVPTRGPGNSRSFGRRRLCHLLAVGRFHFGKNLRRTPSLTQRRLWSERNHPLPKGRQLLDRQHTEKRLQHNGRFAKAGVQIVVKNLQARPVLPPGYSYPFGNVPGCLTCLSLQPGDDFFQSAELAEESRTRPESDKSQQIVGPCNLLGAFTSEKAGAQRRRIRERAELAAMFV